MRNFIGKVLANGATVYDQDGPIVLCHWERPGEERPWVTWVIDHNGNTYSGHYFGNLKAARNEFEQRRPTPPAEDNYDEPDMDVITDARDRAEYEAGKAEAEMRRAERAIYGDELADAFHAQDDLNRYNRGEDD